MEKKLFKILFSLFFCIAIIFTSIYIYLPEEINIIEGEKHLFSFNLPIEAKINSEKKGVMYLNNEKVKESEISIDLKQPFSLRFVDKNISDIDFNVFGVSLKKAKIDTIPNQKLIPVGKVMGIRIFTDGIMVLGTGYVNGKDGHIYEPSKRALRTSDLILEANNEKVDDKNSLINIVEKAGDKDVTLKINRKGNIIYEKITPILSNEDEYKIGIWVRDSTQGIGTITYYNPSTGNYGALGHGIVDVDTSELMTVRTGKLLKSNISCIKKGERGTPGELMGIIIDTARTNFGSVIKNTGYGIFGKLNDRYKKSIQTPETDIALKEEIKLGKAYIYSDVLGDGIEKYEIEIQSVNTLSYDISKGVIIKITDKRLLEATNGIVQGMSGSPIIQNGKIIGAVTHVFVNDPTKGYGIFIENMLKEEKKI